MRFFHCHDCGHKMRLMGESCGYCHCRKAWYQQPGVIFSSLALSAVVAILMIASLS